MKTSELTDAALDWVVANCEGGYGFASDGISTHFMLRGETRVLGTGWAQTMSYHPSTNWAQGGPIIERERISLRGPSICGVNWAAFIDVSGVSQGPQHRQVGPTPLVAAMRCYVASKLGDEVEIPEELT